MTVSPTARRYLMQRRSATTMQAMARGHLMRSSVKFSTRSAPDSHELRLSMLGEFRKTREVVADDWSTTDSDDPFAHTPARQSLGAAVGNSSPKTTGPSLRPRTRGHQSSNQQPPTARGVYQESRYLPGVDGLLTMCREYHSQDRPVECLAIAERILVVEPRHDLV